jgi:hypothetical protein
MSNEESTEPKEELGQPTATLTELKDKLSPPIATLYRAAISLGAQEAQLIWTRYTGFIVMNGFLVSSLAQKEIREQGYVLALLGVIAIILNCVWHVLNYSGWHNQHLFYRQAGNLFSCNLGLLTDYHREGNRCPGGWIYWLAQTIPVMFSAVVAVPCLAISFANLDYLRTGPSWVVSVAIWIVASVGALVIEYKFVNRSKGAV